MKKLIPNYLLLLLLPLAVAAQPTDNPYKTKYTTAPTWTDEIKWDKTLSITNYSDSAGYWDNALAQAMDNVSATGGGVVYFPAGEYKFLRNVTLPEGVVIRGATPSTENSTATDYNFAPPTRWVFPKYEPMLSGDGTPVSTAFRLISASGKKNIGLVYLDINRGRINVGSNGGIMSQNVLVFGVRQNNIAIPQADIPSGFDYMKKWQRFSARHCYNIYVSAEKNAAITNCRINDLDSNTVHPIADDSYDQPGYVLAGRFNPNQETPTGRVASQVVEGVTVDTTHVKYGERARFDYLNHYGIKVIGKYYDPATLDSVIDQQLELNYNWVRTTMRVSIFGEGIGLKINGNIKRDTPGKRVFIHPTGSLVSRGAHETFENRGINFAGENIEIKNNDLNTHRHRYMFSHYSTTDGEGIMIQYQDTWGKRMYDITISDNKLNTYIGFYDIQADFRNINISNNNLMNGGNILIFKKEDTYRIDNLTIAGNTNLTGISVGLKKTNNLYSVKGTNINIINNSGSGSITYPCQATLSNNNTFTDNMICTENMTPTAISPYFGELNVSKTAAVSVTFGPTIVNAVNSVVYIIAGTTDTLTGVTFNIVNNKIEISHPEFSNPNQEYKVVIPANTVKSAATNTPNERLEWWFKTLPAPYIKTTFPTNGMSAVYLNSALTAELMQDFTVVDLTGITVKDAESNTLSGVTATRIPGTRLINISHDDFAPNQTYTVTIPAGAVANASGYTNNQITWSFSTSVLTSETRALPETNLSFSVYPVPAAGRELKISADREVITEWSLYDLSGKEIMHSTGLNTLYTTVNLSKLTPGVYILRVNGGAVFRIIKS